MAKKPTVRIRVSSNHTDTMRPNQTAFESLLEKFLDEAGVFGEFGATLGAVFRGTPKQKGLAGIHVCQMVKWGVEVKAQPGDKSTRRAFMITPPAGLEVERLYELLQKTQKRLRTSTTPAPQSCTTLHTAEEEPEEEEFLEEGEAEIVPPSDLRPIESEEDRLTREYLELDAQFGIVNGRLADLRRQLPVAERELRELEENLMPRLGRELGEALARAAELREELEAAELKKGQQGTKIAQMRRYLAEDTALAARVQAERDDRYAQVTTIEHERKIAGAAKAFKANKSLSPAELLEALTSAGVDIAALLAAANPTK